MRDFSVSYRYGFNGQEHTRELGDNNYTAQFWEYDARVGRRWNLDPVKQINKSDYSVFSNNPIINIDPNGAYSRLGAAWRAVVWGGTTTYSEKRKSWGVTYAGKEWGGAENEYVVKTSFSGGRRSFGIQQRDEYLNQLETQEFWRDEIKNEHVAITNDRFYAMGHWFAFALPSPNLPLPAKEVSLSAEGSEVVTAEVQSVVNQGANSMIDAVEHINPAELTPTHYITNSKKEMQKLLTNINRDGVIESIKYVEYNGVKYIVDGHHRYFSALRSGTKLVPAKQVTLPYAGYKTVADFVLEGNMPGFWRFLKLKP